MLDLLLNELRQKFPYDKTTDRMEVVEKFEMFQRTRAMGLQKYVKEFELRYRKMAREGLTLPEEYRVQRMLRAAHLYPRDRASILAAANKQYVWRKIVSAMQFIFPDGRAPWKPPNERPQDEQQAACGQKPQW